MNQGHWDFCTRIMQYINIACEIGESVHCFFGWIGIASGHGLAWLVDEHIYESCGDSITHQAASNIIARLLPYLSFILLNKAWHNLTHTHIYTNTQTHSYPPRLCWVVGIRVFFVRAQKPLHFCPRLSATKSMESVEIGTSLKILADAMFKPSKLSRICENF